MDPFIKHNGGKNAKISTGSDINKKILLLKRTIEQHLMNRLPLKKYAIHFYSESKIETPFHTKILKQEKYLPFSSSFSYAKIVLSL